MVQASDAFSFPTNVTIVNGLNASNVLVSVSIPVTTRCLLNGFFLGYSNYLYVATPITTNWCPSAQKIYVLTAIVTDGLGNSAMSTLTVPVYLDSNGDGVPDVIQIGQGNDPLNPWIPPTGDSDPTPPIINLIIPANAQLQ